MHVPCHIRWMIRMDMTEVLRIENQFNDHRWEEQDFFEELRDRHTIGMVAEHADKIVGFFIYQRRKKSINVVKFRVNPDYFRSGVGTQMIDKLLLKTGFGRNRVTFEIGERNLDMQLFLKKNNFKAVKTNRESFSDTGEDGYVFVRERVKEIKK